MIHRIYTNRGPLLRCSQEVGMNQSLLSLRDAIFSLDISTPQRKRLALQLAQKNYIACAAVGRVEA